MQSKPLANAEEESLAQALSSQPENVLNRILQYVQKRTAHEQQLQSVALVTSALAITVGMPGVSLTSLGQMIERERSYTAIASIAKRALEIKGHAPTVE